MIGTAVLTCETCLTNQPGDSNSLLKLFESTYGLEFREGDKKVQCHVHSYPGSSYGFCTPMHQDDNLLRLAKLVDVVQVHLHPQL